MKDETDNCYLVWGEEGILQCTYNHKIGSDCLALICEYCRKLPSECDCYQDLKQNDHER